GGVRVGGGAGFLALPLRAGPGGARGLAGSFPLRDLRRAGARALHRLLGGERPPVLRGAADPGGRWRRGIGGAAARQRRDPPVARRRDRGGGGPPLVSGGGHVSLRPL